MSSIFILHMQYVLLGRIKHTRMKTFCDGGGINEVSSAQVAHDVFI